jgi:hypothetical protein
MDPTIREVIAHEVYKALHDTMPRLLAGAKKDMRGKKEEAKKKKKPTLELEVIA